MELKVLIIKKLLKFVDLDNYILVKILNLTIKYEI